MSSCAMFLALHLDFPHAQVYIVWHHRLKHMDEDQESGQSYILGTWEHVFTCSQVPRFLSHSYPCRKIGEDS